MIFITMSYNHLYEQILYSKVEVLGVIYSEFFFLPSFKYTAKMHIFMVMHKARNSIKIFFFSSIENKNNDLLFKGVNS